MKADFVNTLNPKMAASQPIDLAIFGRPPRYASPVHVGRPNIGNRESFINRVGTMFDNRWLTNHGPLVQEFERRVADHIGVKHCIAVCNATIALQVAIRALNMRGEVIVPSFTFVATAHALQWEEITPVFCDIDPQTHLLDSRKVESLITPRTTGIIGVHLWGQACAVKELSEIATRRNLRLLFDAAHAFGCSTNSRMLGSFGEAEVFSFHATKFFNTFEGGAVTTNSDELANKIRLMTNFGFSGTDRVIYVGTNGKMSEVSAAMGLCSLESIGQFIKANQRNYLQYCDELDGLPGLRVFPYHAGESNNFQYVVVEVDETVADIHRDDVLEALHAENILARRYFYPGVHRMEPYRSFFPHAGLLLPETEKLAQKVLILPTGTTIGPEDIKCICRIIHLCFEHPQEIAKQIGARGRKCTPDLR
jgi:dTDP-4-amino-4,6-dideoxygalactose transaminase